MNTIIIHVNNRVKRTPMHDMTAALIAPVSPWYRKPVPWWSNGFEEVGLQPIVEADETAEDEEGEKRVPAALQFKPEPLNQEEIRAKVEAEFASIGFGLGTPTHLRQFRLDISNMTRYLVRRDLTKRR